MITSYGSRNETQHATPILLGFAPLVPAYEGTVTDEAPYAVEHDVRRQSMGACLQGREPEVISLHRGVEVQNS
jgi:hypothetical protein